MKNKTEIGYRLSWKSGTEDTRKEAYFVYLKLAEKWYSEKLAEGKNPQLWKEETTTTFEAMRPQQQQEESRSNLLDSSITFNKAEDEIIRIDAQGFHYRGQFIEDAGEAHRLLVEFLRKEQESN